MVLNFEKIDSEKNFVQVFEKKNHLVHLMYL